MFLPVDASEAGHWIDGLFYLAFWLVTITFIAVIGILIFFLIKYRASNTNQKAYYTKGESRQAVLLTLLFAVFIFFVIDVNLAVHDHRAWEKAIGGPIHGIPVRVQVLAQQFAWNIRYAGADGEFGTPDDVLSINQMHVPKDQPVLLALKSKDVIHSYFVPNFRVKQDVVPGMITMLTFKPVKEGQYDIACAEHCGLGHYRMRGILTVESKENFEKWLAERGAQPGTEPNWGWEWKF